MKIMEDVEGKFWTRQNEMIAELESLGYEAIEIGGTQVVVVDTYDEDEPEIILDIGMANRTMWIQSAR